MSDEANITIISTGRELVCGRSVDTNSGFIADSLTGAGLNIRKIIIVGDHPALITQELRAAAERSGFILMTGGLGPTADDRTRKAIAQASNEPLIQRHEAIENIKNLLQKRGRRFTNRYLSQAAIPGEGAVFPNEIGTACGFSVKIKNAQVIAMPGVPEEMRYMFRCFILPYLLKQYSLNGGEEGFRCTEKVNIFGMPESDVNNKIEDMLDESRNPAVGLCVDNSNITISIAAKAATKEKAQKLLEKDIAQIQQLLGKAVYSIGEVSLAGTVLAQLREKGYTMAVAESCTGGIISDMLIGVPGASDCFNLGLVAYSNPIKTSLLGVSSHLIRKYGAVSPQVAKAMAAGGCKVGQSDIAVSTTGVAGPKGGTALKPVGLVYIGLHICGEGHVYKHIFSGNRRQIRERAAGWALNHLRLQIGQSV